MAKKSKAPPAPAPPSKLVIFDDFDQGSPEWFKVRLGIPTASVFSTVMASGKDGGDSIGREKLLRKLAGEILTGQPAEEEFRNVATERGRALEDEARQSYCRRKGVEIRRVAFGRNFEGLKLCGASPDSLVGFDGGLEVKTARADVIQEMLNNPASAARAHRAQVHGNMMVFERDWWDLTIYSHANLPAIDVRIYRDETYLRELVNQIEIFNFDLKKRVEQIRKMGAAG